MHTVRVRTVLYPTRVTLPNGAMTSPAMVAVTDAVIAVYALLHGAPYRVFRGELAGEPAHNLDTPQLPRDRRWLTVHTAEGVVTVAATSGCSCGPLGQFTPQEML
ncbi:hypothetical protein [Frankia sp. Cj3]|uniref:hypothetical protein n=1 Tax=Frankia sp. Cj3 TaxID=2880976 RepID=UPI001EF45112|nr:hypothetical protein [Frankia sp. Cj3]